MMNRKRFGRTLAALLAAAIVICAAPVGAQAASAGSFTDVSSSDWYYSAVDYVVSKGLFNGTGNGTFSPNSQMSRAMFVTVLGRYAGVDPAAWLSGTVTGSGVNLRSGAGTAYDVIGTLNTGDAVSIQGFSDGWYQVGTGAGSGYVSGDYVAPNYGSFSDVGYGAYYAGYAVWAKEKGIVTGTGGDSFSPDASITREQMCAMLNRFLSAMGVSLPQTSGAASFPDSGSISSWAVGDVDAMQRCGIIKGNADGKLNPRGTATRAETATMLQRFDTAKGGAPFPSQAPDKPSPPVQDSGSTTPPATESTPPVTESTPPSQEPAPPAGDSSDPNSLPDTPASLIGGAVGIKSSIIRVGILVKTGGIDTSVSTVTLQSLSGSGFEVGTMSDRQFIAATSVFDANVTVTTDGSTFTVTDSAGAVAYTSTAGEMALRPADGGYTCVNGEYRYAGSFNLLQASGKAGYITVVNYVDIEDYVKGVVPYEFPNSFPAEALKAAAVACRSFVMSYDWSIYGGYGMDIVTGAGTQLYRGRGISYSDSSLAPTDSAVEATRGIYLTYNGSICITNFSSCDGGATRSASDVFGTNYPYLTGKADPYEQAAAGDIAAAGGDYGSMVSNSHKVGMSAWGAFAMAKYYGKSYESILGFYYTGTSLQYGA